MLHKKQQALHRESLISGRFISDKSPFLPLSLSLLVWDRSPRRFYGSPLYGEAAQIGARASKGSFLRDLSVITDMRRGPMEEQ